MKFGLRTQEECDLQTQNERKNSVIDELQRIGTSKSVKEMQDTKASELIEQCKSASFTNWCDVLSACGMPSTVLDYCSASTQEGKKNTFIYLLTNGDKTQESEYQGETDDHLKLQCPPANPANPTAMVQKVELAEAVRRGVAMASDKRLAALRARQLLFEQEQILTVKDKTLATLF